MKEFDKLVEIVGKLRDSDGGCPWDLEQTPGSLIPNFIEELYEAIEAIENNDHEHLSEELGDLLLHIIMQAQMAKEEEFFSIEDVLKKINEKLVRRHPHVFGDKSIHDPNQVKMNWEKIKLKEKEHSRKSVIDGIPKSMPSLITAQRMQEKAASVGFDWKSVQPAIEKLHEEVKEFENAFSDGDIKEIQNEVGDMLFSIVNISRKMGFDAESSLKKTIRKFERRFKMIEKHHHDNQKDINESSLEQLDEIWDIAKKSEL